MTDDLRQTDEAAAREAAAAPAAETDPEGTRESPNQTPNVRKPGAHAAPEEVVEGEIDAPVADDDAELKVQLDERVRDLQRITAEYANYRKRVDRDRALVTEQATGNLLAALLPVLDDIDRAREHGDLVGPFASVAEQLTVATTKFGLTAFGAKGDPFDPTRHEAVAHLNSSDVTEPTCVDVMRRGYLLGERLLRPALVAVADPDA